MWGSRCLLGLGVRGFLLTGHVVNELSDAHLPRPFDPGSWTTVWP